MASYKHPCGRICPIPKIEFITSFVTITLPIKVYFRYCRNIFINFELKSMGWVYSCTTTTSFYSLVIASFHVGVFRSCEFIVPLIWAYRRTIIPSRSINMKTPKICTCSSRIVDMNTCKNIWRK